MDRKYLKSIVFVASFVMTAFPVFAGSGMFDVASVDPAVYRHRERTVLSPDVCENHEFYNVMGGEEKDLREQMTRNGIAWRDGRKYDSLTSWHLEWAYEHDRSPESCSAEAFQASAKITIRYPRWIPTEDAPQELVDKWHAYVANLVLHEEGHRDMVIEAIEDITRAVALLPGAPSCAELDRMVRSLCHARMAKLNDETRAYDDMTYHGAEQGAVFP